MFVEREGGGSPLVLIDHRGGGGGGDLEMTENHGLIFY